MNENFTPETNERANQIGLAVDSLADRIKEFTKQPGALDSELLKAVANLAFGIGTRNQVRALDAGIEAATGPTKLILMLAKLQAGKQVEALLELASNSEAASGIFEATIQLAVYAYQADGAARSELIDLCREMALVNDAMGEELSQNNQ